MDNQETPATLGTRATGRRQTKQQQKTKTKTKQNKTKTKAKTKKQTKTEKMSNTNPQKKTGVKRCSRHVTHIVKAGTNSLDNGGIKKST